MFLVSKARPRADQRDAIEPTFESGRRFELCHPVGDFFESLHSMDDVQRTVDQAYRAWCAEGPKRSVMTLVLDDKRARLAWRIRFESNAVNWDGPWSYACKPLSVRTALGAVEFHPPETRRIAA
ncbi:MAG TPA: hypothetical protein VGX78_10500 [Pirellulales bacterium]|jgi:hypothetical protein|nr:hypothetical protein [Pirellulales bacterium]